MPDVLAPFPHIYLPIVMSALLLGLVISVKVRGETSLHFVKAMLIALRVSSLFSVLGNFVILEKGKTLNYFQPKMNDTLSKSLRVCSQSECTFTKAQRNIPHHLNPRLSHASVRSYFYISCVSLTCRWRWNAPTCIPVGWWRSAWIEPDLDETSCPREPVSAHMVYATEY